MKTLDGTSADRKGIPLYRGVLKYFPDALVGVAQLSVKGNEQHNLEGDIHWDRSKSKDHADCLLRHLLRLGEEDSDGIPEHLKVAWRALAIAQEMEEKRLHSLDKIPLSGVEKDS